MTTVSYELDAVEQGVDVLEWLAPSVAGVEAFRTWWDLAGNRAASPTMARAVGAVAVKGDVRDVLERITAPTLIVHRRGSTYLPPEHGRYLAERITQSTYVELPGADTLYWVGDTAELLDEIEEIVTGVRAWRWERPSRRHDPLHRHRRLDETRRGPRRRPVARSWDNHVGREGSAACTFASHRVGASTPCAIHYLLRHLFVQFLGYFDLKKRLIGVRLQWWLLMRCGWRCVGWSLMRRGCRS